MARTCIEKVVEDGRERRCDRQAEPGWPRCADHVDRWLDRVMGVRAPEPQPELPRWSPAA